MRRLKATQQFIQFVGRVEVGFQFAGSELVAQFIEAASKQIEPGGKNFPVGQHNVPPSAVGTASKAQRVAQAGTSKRDRQAVFIQMIVEKGSQRDGRELRKVRGEAHGVI